MGLIKKLIMAIMAIAALPIILLILIILAIIGIILVILDAYSFCTIPFELECRAPDSIYAEDVVSEREIEDIVQQMIVLRENQHEALKNLNNTEYIPELYVEIPYLDNESVEEQNKKEGFKNEREIEKGTKEYYINENNPSLSHEKMKEDLNRVKGFENMYDDFSKAARDNGIDLGFLIAFSISGTSHGNSTLVTKYNNIGFNTCENFESISNEIKEKFRINGCQQEVNGEKYLVFHSKKDSVNYLAYRLNEEHVKQGYKTIKEVLRNGEEDLYKKARSIDNKFNSSNFENSIKKRLINYGLSEDEVDMDERIVPGRRHELRPDFEKYDFMQEYIYEFVGDNKLVELALKGLYGKKHYKQISKDAYINEAEIHLRTLLQNDLSGIFGLDFDQLEADLMLKIMYHKITNNEKGNKDGLYREFFDITPFTIDDVLNSREQYYELIVDSELSQKEEERLKLTDAEKLTHNNYPYRKEVLRRSATLQIYYPYLIVLYGEEPDFITEEVFEKMKKAVLDAYEERKEEIEENSLELTLLSLGRYLQERGLRDFRNRFDWFNPFDDVESVREMYEYINFQRYRGSEYVDENGNIDLDKIQEDVEKAEDEGRPWYKRFWNNLTSDLSLENVYDFFYSMNIDSLVKNNDGVRALMYHETQEVMELGALVRARCFFVEKYGYEQGTWFNKDDFCVQMNTRTFGEGVMTWENSQTVNKLKNESVLSSFRVSRIPEYKAELREMEEKLEEMEEKLEQMKAEFKKKYGIPYDDSNDVNKQQNNEKKENTNQINEHNNFAVRAFFIGPPVPIIDDPGIPPPVVSPPPYYEEPEPPIVEPPIVEPPEDPRLRKDREAIKKFENEVKKYRKEVEAFRKRVQELEKLKNSIDERRAKTLGQAMEEAKKVRNKLTVERKGITDEIHFTNIAKNVNFYKRQFRARDVYRGIEFHDYHQLDAWIIDNHTELMPFLSEIMEGKKEDFADGLKYREYYEKLYNIYYKSLKKHYENNKKYNKEINELAKIIQQYTDKSYENSLLKAYLITLKDYNVVLYDTYGTVVGYISKPNDREILDGTIRLHIVELQFNTEFIIEFSENKGINPEVERLEFDLISKSNPYYVTPYDIFRKTKEFSVYPKLLTKIGYYEKYDKDNNFDLDSYYHFLAMVNADYSKDEKFLFDFEKYMIYGSSDFGTVPEYEGGIGNAVEAGIFEGVEIVLPVSLTEGEKARITSLYGYRSNGMHYGLDIGRLSSGRIPEVVSIADGVIQEIRKGCIEGNMSCHGGWGNTVLVRHTGENGVFFSRYAHLKEDSIPNSLSVGQEIPRGTVLGVMGNTGNSYGAHLHLEINQRVYNTKATTIDPMLIIDFNDQNALCISSISVRCKTEYNINGVSY